jgi:outer membrane protein, heavy metal efflux system
MFVGKTRQVLLGLLFILGGCTRYKAIPLSPSAVQSGLAAPGAEKLRIEAKSIEHPLLKPVDLDDRDGLTPDQAAILAVLVNPSLRAARDERGLASAQLLQAGILPNPQLNFGEQIPYGGVLQNAVTASAVGVSWDLTELLSHAPKVNAARAGAASVDLDIAWREWQTAQAARSAVYDLVFLQMQLDLATQIDRQLSENLAVIRTAVDQHDKTLLDLSEAESASLDAHAAFVSQQRDFEDARLTLTKTLGLAPDAQIKLNPKIAIDDNFPAPTAGQVLSGLEQRRLDLVALRLGYQSQEETLRAAVLEQFPKVNLGFNRQRDDTNIQSLGFAVTIDLPIFDRNQGVIAVETATRQKLFDEYLERVFEARYDVYTAIDDLSAISRQIAAEESAFPSLQRLVDTCRDAYNHGNVDVLSYYSAIDSLAQKQLDVLKLRQQLTDNRIALELAAGEYLPE